MVDAGQLRRVAVASSIGTTIEWFDFFIFSTAVPLVFNTQFFSTLSPASGTLAGFAALGVGILARPVGGVLWGHFGDRVGRKAMLVASLVLMGGATVGVGCCRRTSRSGCSRRSSWCCCGYCRASRPAASGAERR